MIYTCTYNMYICVFIYIHIFIQYFLYIYILLSLFLRVCVYIYIIYIHIYVLQNSHSYFRVCVRHAETDPVTQAANSIAFLRMYIDLPSSKSMVNLWCEKR